MTLARLGFFLLLFTASTSYAETQASMFGTLGGAYSDADSTAFRSNVAIADYSEEFDFKSFTRVGLQFQSSFSDRWHVTTQWLLKNRVEQDLDSLTQLAFITYAPSAQVKINVGRTALDLFMLSPYRQTGFAYTATHAPVELYGIIPHQNIDGIELATTQNIGDGLLSTRWYAGQSDEYLVDSNDERAWNFELDHILGATFEYEVNEWLVRANYTQTHFGNQPASQSLLINATDNALGAGNDISKRLVVEGKHIQYFAIGTKFDTGQYYVNSELAHIHSASKAVREFTSGYANLGKRWHDFTLQLGFAFTDANRDYLSVEESDNLDNRYLAQQLDSGLNYYVNDQTTLSLSARYELTANSAVKLQIEQIDVKVNDSQLVWSEVIRETQGTLNVVSATLDWVY